MTSNSTELNISPELTSLCKIAGALFYYRPTDYEQYGIDKVIMTPETTGDLSNLFPQFNHMIKRFKQANIDDLTIIHDHYFAAIHGTKTPPWGSVYLDKDRILFAQSTIEYKDFLIQNGFEFETNNKDPLDHIGLMLMVVGEFLSQLDESKQNETTLNSLQQLLGYHLLPWSNHYLTKIHQDLAGSSHEKEAYSELVNVTKLLLDYLAQQLSIEIEPRQVFIYGG